MSFALVAAYAFFSFSVIFFERRRVKLSGVDIISVFNMMYLLNFLIPPIFVYAYEDVVVGLNSLTETVLPAAGIEQKIYLLYLTVLAYFGVLLGFKILRPSPPRTPLIGVDTAGSRPLKIYWIFGILVFSISAYLFSNSIGGGWEGIALASQYRAGVVDATEWGTGFYYKAISISLPIALIGSSSLASTSKGKFFFFLAELVVIVFAALFTGSRRVILVWLLLKLFLSLHAGKKIGWIPLLLIVVVSAVVVTYGEDFFLAIAGSGGDALFDSDTESEGLVDHALSLISMDLGISFIESLGMLSLYQGGLRFGIDSLSYVFSFPPLSFFSLFEDERFVRYTTTLLTGDQWTADIPPGFIGYMWVNFGMIGVFFQSVIYGLLGGWIARTITSKVPSRVNGFVYFYFAYIWSVLINSGNWEFWIGDYLLANIWVLGLCAVALMREK